MFQDCDPIFRAFSLPANNLKHMIGLINIWFEQAILNIVLNISKSLNHLSFGTHLSHAMNVNE
jgi:hypothetical protein